VHDDEQVEAVGLAGLDEQGDVVHDHGARVGGARGGLALGREAADLGMDDPLEADARGVVGEDDAAERRPVERPVGREHALAEGLDHLLEPHRAGRDGVACQLVVVDDDRAELAEATRDDRLPRGDAAREPDPEHAVHDARHHRAPPRPAPRT
jgi:hypothetical protein